MGGDTHDALLLLGDAASEEPGKLLRNILTIPVARGLLGLPEGLEVPDGPESCVIRHFNSEDTAGPYLRSQGIRKKMGGKKEKRASLLYQYDWQYKLHDILLM